MSLPWAKRWDLLNKHKAEQMIKMQDKDMISQTFLVPKYYAFIEITLPPQTVPTTKNQVFISLSLLAQTTIFYSLALVS